MCDADFANDLFVPVVLALCAEIVKAKTRELESVNAELRRSIGDISSANKVAGLEEEIEYLRGRVGDMELAVLKEQVAKEAHND